MFTNIIHPLRKAFCLSMNEYAVIDSVYFLSHNNKYGGWCVAPKQTIANELDLSERTVFSAIEKGTVKGLIVKNELGHLQTTDTWNEIMANKHDWYIAFNGKESQFVSGKSNPAKIADTMQNLQGTMQNLQTDSAIIADNHNKNNIIINKKECIPSREDAFTAFWVAYPRKVGRLSALKAWGRLHVPLDKCLKTIEALKKTRQWEVDGGKYIPHPATWLNRGGWEDVPEIDVPKDDKFYIEELTRLRMHKFIRMYGEKMFCKYSDYYNPQ